MKTEIWVCTKSKIQKKSHVRCVSIQYIQRNGKSEKWIVEWMIGEMSEWMQTTNVVELHERLISKSIEWFFGVFLLWNRDSATSHKSAHTNAHAHAHAHDLLYQSNKFYENGCMHAWSVWSNVAMYGTQLSVTTCMFLIEIHTFQLCISGQKVYCACKRVLIRVTAMCQCRMFSNEKSMFARNARRHIAILKSRLLYFEDRTWFWIHTTHLMKNGAQEIMVTCERV